jgi:hypothetical protein
MGLEKNQDKAMELYQWSYALGSPEAADRLYYYNLDIQHLRNKYMKETAFWCHINASITLGVEELNYGTVDTTKSLIIRGAKVGDSDAINILMKMYNMRNYQKKS